MYEIYNNTLCVPAKWLFGKGEVLTKSNYDNLLQRGQMRSARRGGNGRKALIEFYSIPERFRIKVISKLGNPKKFATDPDRKERNSIDKELVVKLAADFVRNYLKATTNNR